MKHKIFQNFPSADKQAWVDQAKKDLKGGDFEKQLVTIAMEGFPVYPYYAAEDTADTQWIKTYDNRINPISDIPGESARHWINAVEVLGKDEAALNKEIKLLLENGADGLILSLSEGLDLDKVFDGVLLPYISVWIKTSGDILPVVEAFAGWLGRQDLNVSDLKGGILWDGLRLGFDQSIQIEEQIDRIAFIHQLFASYPLFKSICLDSSVYPNAGSTAVQELGYGLAALVELWDGLTGKGIKPEALFSDLFVLTAVGSDYFMEIAKLKTFRIALHQLAKLYKVDLLAEEIQLFASTSRWSKSFDEPYNNLLRNTTEAMSAIIGGCNALFVAPHDQDLDTPAVFSSRMARNISTILREESYFDKAVDPAAGSYYIENLIHSLYEESLKLLKNVESEGGWWKLYANHQIQKEVKVMRNIKFQQLIQGETKKVGIAERTPDNTFTHFQEEDYQLRSCSHFLPYEQIL